MKYISTAALILFYSVSNGQTLSFEMKAAPGITFPLGKLNQQFWVFPEDSNTSYKNIKAKKYPLFGAFFSPALKIAYKPKRNIAFTLETGLDYYYKRYRIDWSALAESPFNTQTFNANYKVTKHEVGLNVLPGLTYKNVTFSTGLKILFTFNSVVTEQVLRGGNLYLDIKLNEIDEPSFPLSVTMPFSVSYTIPLSNKLQLIPFACYEIGIGELDGYAINWNRREETMLTELLVGITLNVQLKR